jgi:hypothetical protein
MKLTYHDESHRYYLDGKRCKSASTIAKRLEDGYRLDLWKQRQVAIGVASHPALIDRIAAHFDDKDALNAIVEEAHTHAKTHQAADRGTAMHRFTERADNNEAILETELATATIHAWRTALPDQLVCGRMDRIVQRRRDGRMFILDLKTGAKALQYPHSIAVQLAIYANAPVAYRIDGQSGSSDTMLRLPAELDRTVALVFAMPTPDEWSIVPVRIDRAWHVASTALFLALEWEKADDLVMPAIVEHTPAPAPAAVADDPFAGLPGVAPQDPPVDPIVDEATTGASSGAPVESDVVCRGCARPVATDAGVCATCHTIVPAAALPTPVEAPDPDPADTGAGTYVEVEAPAYTTREWIIERVRQVALLHPQALDALAALWPAGVPALASKALISPEQWKLVDRAVMEIEKRTDAPFIPGPRNHEQDGWVQRLSDAATAPRKPVAPPPPAEPADAPDHHVDAVCMLLASLEQGQPAEWAERRLVEAKDAGVGIKIRTVRSMRLVNIGYAIHAWARINDDRLTRLGMALLPDATFIDDRPLGVIFATLTSEQASMLREIAEGVTDGTWQYRCDDQGGERFVQAARA